MLIIIPTYKRLETVPLVVLSLLSSNVPNVTDRLMVAIVNNDPSSSQQVEIVVRQVWNNHPFSSNWQLVFLHRATTIPAADNWYHAFFELAIENEMVILQGDDDLFTKDGLTYRVKASNESGSDFLLSYSRSNLTFIKENQIYFEGGLDNLPEGSGKIDMLGFDDFEQYGPVFIGSHTYRFNEVFRSAYGLVQQWIKFQERWLDYDHRTLMYPYYMAIAYIVLKAKVYGLAAYCCIRGTSLQEKLDSPYNSSRGWNSGFLSLIVLDLFNNGPLKDFKELDTSRRINQNEAANWYLTTFIDSRVAKDKLKYLYNHLSISLLPKNIFFGVKIILQQHLHLKHIRLRKDIRKGKFTYSSKQLLQQLFAA